MFTLYCADCNSTKLAVVQPKSFVALFPTQSHYPDTRPTSPNTKLLMLIAVLVSRAWPYDVHGLRQ